MRSLPYTKEAYELLHRGTQAFAEIEANGMVVDEEYLERAIVETREKIRGKQEALGRSKVTKVWRERFRTRTNLNSPHQLGKVLYEDMGFKSHAKTEKGSYKTDEETLARIDHPFIRKYLGVKRLQKGLQFLQGIKTEVCQGFLHPVFNLHLVRTYRSSSDSPNFQNLPVRNPWMKHLVRRVVIPRPGRRLVEVDYSGIEVRVATCYHQDPRMVEYIQDPTTDMHRDMAMECYLLDQDQVTKDARYCAKNKFVFPEFYGSWWLDCSASLWHAIGQLKLQTTSGVPLKDHLVRHGIKALGAQNRKNPNPKVGTFEAHIQKVERRFWNDRFPVYAAWKKEWYQSYLDKGWLLTHTGFICSGQMVRNDVINYPVQGSAFHCLLWALIQLNKELRRRRMKALVIGQIHDSIVADVPDEEVVEYISLAREVMVIKLMKEWDWITIPLEIEVEITPLGGSWVDKQEWKGGPLP